MDEIKPTRSIDVRGKKCPYPLVITKTEIEKLNHGDILEIITTDPDAPDNISEWAKDQKHEVLGIEKSEEAIKIYLKKKAKTLTVVLNRGPYISEYTDVALNLALKAREKGYNVNLYLYIDGVWAPHKKQNPKNFPNIEEHFKKMIEKGVNIKVCARCAEARGLTQDVIVGDLPLVGLYDLIYWLKESHQSISFPG
ncbi:MAG: sulfurtransferase TusA family protein [Candidatus Hydrothermarchaeota archaeon]